MPESAVIDTGDRKVVYVEAEPGVFEGREVVLGPRSGDRFPVLEASRRREGRRGRRLPDRRREPAQPGDRGARPSPATAPAAGEPAGRRGPPPSPPRPTGTEPTEERAMIESIIEWSIRNRYLVILAVAGAGRRRASAP